MKHLVLALGIILCSAASQKAAAAEVIFDGQLVFTAVRDCPDFEVGRKFISVYHIANLGDNRDDTTITAIYRNGGSGYTLRNGGRFTAEFQRVEGVEIGSGTQRFTSRLRITKSVPARPGVTTRQVFLTGEIQRAFGNQGEVGENCVAAFNAAYIRRTD